MTLQDWIDAVEAAPHMRQNSILRTDDITTHDISPPKLLRYLKAAYDIGWDHGAKAILDRNILPLPTRQARWGDDNDMGDYEMGN